MWDIIRQNAHILVVDDEEANVALLDFMLRQGGYTHVLSTTDSTQVLSLYDEFQPDLLLLDLHMPIMDGFDVLRALNPYIPPDAYLPILVLTADVTFEAKEKALSSGAKDYLTEVLLRVRNLLEVRFLSRWLQSRGETLQDQVVERTHTIDRAQLEMIDRLSRAVEFRDDVTGHHTQRVGEHAAQLALALGLPESASTLIRQAAPLHDVGKIGIPDQILLKPGPLTPAEYDLVKTHTTIGATILTGSPFRLLQHAEEIARSHHERWDGTGYPLGLVGEVIPLAGRIVAVVDAFDVITHARPYKHAEPVDFAVSELRRGSGSQFDPRVVQAFLEGLGAGG
jgi:putative two-component system response regulator